MGPGELGLTERGVTRLKLDGLGPNKTRLGLDRLKMDRLGPGRPKLRKSSDDDTNSSKTHGGLGRPQEGRSR